MVASFGDVGQPGVDVRGVAVAGETLRTTAPSPGPGPTCPSISSFAAPLSRLGRRCRGPGSPPEDVAWTARAADSPKQPPHPRGDEDVAGADDDARARQPSGRGNRRLAPSSARRPQRSAAIAGENQPLCGGGRCRAPSPRGPSAKGSRSASARAAASPAGQGAARRVSSASDPARSKESTPRRLGRPSRPRPGGTPPAARATDALRRIAP